MAAPNPLAPAPFGVTNPFAPSQAGVGLGMGADLQKQVMDQIMQRRKASLLTANQQPAAFGALAMGTNTTGAGNTGGLALQALMNTGVPLNG